MTQSHIPVLMQEVLSLLITNKQGIYVDGTFGRGGHSRAILNALSPEAKLIAIDQDLTAIEVARQTINDARFTIVHGSFANLQLMPAIQQYAGHIDGIFLDIGVSSPQLDEPQRGFSFMHDGPLDMRMDQTQPLTAATWINTASVEDMTRVFREYGEERFAKRIAKAIAAKRESCEIETTKQLADIITDANPSWEKHKHPATRCFQGIRIHINQELQALAKALEHSLALLKSGGRLAVISFHSLEDRMVKQFMRKQQRGQELPKGLPIRDVQTQRRMKLVSKAIKASPTELTENIRSRSAVLRVAEKLS